MLSFRSNPAVSTSYLKMVRYGLKMINMTAEILTLKLKNKQVNDVSPYVVYEKPCLDGKIRLANLN